MNSKPLIKTYSIFFLIQCAVLFAIPQLRNVQPGIPSIGCASDTVGFFWNMALIAVALLLLMWNYIIYKKEKSDTFDLPNRKNTAWTTKTSGLTALTMPYSRKP